MIDAYTLRQIADAKAMADRLVPDLSHFQKCAEQASRFAREIEAMSAAMSSFDRYVLQDRTWTYAQRMVDDHNRLIAGMEQSQKDVLLVAVTLPKRGWYLSGQEPCTLSNRLARSIRNDRLDQVDEQMMVHLPQFKVDKLCAWLVQEGVPAHCVDRVSRFLRHHGDGNYEEATFLGVPLLDELAKYLYGGKAFTTKRPGRRGSDQSKPELAFKTTSAPDLGNYCARFVQAFGSLQEDPDHNSLADENYWNRHAIVHGLMQRAMGVKDSAKCLMAISFLLFARQQEGEEEVVADEEEPSQAVED